jgi:uncharacterized damage-inducible protein DinB
MQPANAIPVPPFYQKYVDLVPQGASLSELLEQNIRSMHDFLSAIPEEKWSFRYAEGKWSIKELVLHLADAERIFSYRALCIARGETASLPGFDENKYAALSNADARDKESLIQELKAVQTATALLFQSFDDAQLERTGTANNNPIQVRTIGAVAAGHLLHHKNILQERYVS